MPERSPSSRESDDVTLEIRVVVKQDGRPVHLALLERAMANALPEGMSLADCCIRRVPDTMP